MQRTGEAGTQTRPRVCSTDGVRSLGGEEEEEEEEEEERENKPSLEFV